MSSDHQAPPPLYFFATSRGGTTLDQGEGGGNPFAGALVELLDRKRLTLRALRSALGDLTERKSRGWQHPDLPALAELPARQFLPKRTAEVRVALVLVFSDYSASGMQPLEGARHDAKRVASALRRAGFVTRATVDPTRSALSVMLRGFATRSAKADVALVYTTGHGVDVSGRVYVLPGDYPISRGNEALPTLALGLTDLGLSARAKRCNLVFYAGCRNNPFG